MITEKHFEDTLVRKGTTLNGYASNNSIHNFCLIGINYRSSDTGVRSKFSIAAEQYYHLIQLALSRGIFGCLVLSTCNRTEVYGMCHDPRKLIEILCEIKHCNTDEFYARGYICQGFKAIKHMFKVASGLDSQIIGDTEILGQMKLAAKIAKQQAGINSTMERIINSALQVSKEIRTKTRLNSGTVSVSYAAIEIIRERITDVKGRNILVVGTGKFGNQIAKNVNKYVGEAILSFTNRTDEKAFNLAMKYDANFVRYHNLRSAIDDSDIIIVNSSAESYTILPSFFTTAKQRLILDLSVPINVHPSVKNIEGISLLNVDEVSGTLNKTIALRRAEVSKATNIIEETLESLLKWHRLQSNGPFLRQVKSQLYRLSEVDKDRSLREEYIHKTVSSLAIRLKHKTNKGCQCINTLNNFLQIND